MLIYKNTFAQMLKVYTINGCMQDTFARALTRPKGQARATIGYPVYKLFGVVSLVYKIPSRARQDILRAKFKSPILHRFYINETERFFMSKFRINKQY